MKMWLHKCCEVEVNAEILKVEQCCGDLWRMSSPRNSADRHLGNKTLYVGTDKRGTCQPGMKICPASSESYPDEGNNLSHHWRQESKSSERKKYTLSQDEGTSPYMCIRSPRPINKSKQLVDQVPVKKKKSITMDEYRARNERRCREQECQEAKHRQQEEEALQKLNEMRSLD